jgi:selenocysteine-specific elongation factor
MDAVLRPFLIGTAGHVDHGKTTLVQAITGTNTDRLAEEQRRGMSIDLGFAEFHLPSGRVAGIVDVPGHERFLKNMLAGAAGVDFGLLVIAADEGVMPQTVEHLAIMQALRIPRGLTVLAKADTVDPDHLEIVTENVRAALAGTFLQDAPILPVDSVSGRGLQGLVGRLDETAAALPPHELDRPEFLPVDRVFQRPGFGVVVTGSLRAGRIREGDSVTIYPSGKAARVRGLQTFGQKETVAEAGMRTAVNLAGVDTEDIERGDVLAATGSLAASDRMNVLIEADDLIRPLKHRTRVRVHIGTDEVLARILLWEGTELRPGVPALAQLHLERLSVARRGDRFVLRWYSPPAFLGGGEVLEPAAPPFRTRDAGIVRRLQALLGGNAGEIVLETLAASGPAPVSAGQIAGRAGLDLALAEAALETAVTAGTVVKTRTGFVLADHFRRVSSRWKARLASYHRKAPLRAGMPKDELRTQDDPTLPAAAFEAVLAALAERGEIALERDLVRLPGHSVALRPDQQAAADEIVAVFRDSGWQPPYEIEVTRGLGPHRATKELWDHLAASGEIVTLAPGLYLHRETAEAGVRAVREILVRQGSITVGDFRDSVGASRKYAVPFLEWCDSQRLTRRDGDHRIRGPVL